MNIHLEKLKKFDKGTDDFDTEHGDILFYILNGLKNKSRTSIFTMLKNTMETMGHEFNETGLEILTDYYYELVTKRS